MSALTASFDDIIFEGRNQAYGAYQLRQDYQSRLTRAGGITLSLCALLLGGWLAWPAAQPRVEVKHPGVVETTPIELPSTVIEKPVVAPPPPVAPAQAAQPPVATHPAATIPTRVVQDNLVPLTPPDLRELAAVDGPVGPATAATGTTETSSTGGAPGGTNTEATASTITAPTEPYHYVEKMPEFAGGQAALMRYLREHLRYPSQALREGQEGRVYMSFVVGADGRISDAAVMKGLGYGLDEEALRVVRQMPAWTPGYQAQHAVPVRFTLPITFKIQ